MAAQDLLRNKVDETPTIYAYTLPDVPCITTCARAISLIRQKQEDREFNYVNERKPFVCFASFQDVLGKNAMGGIKATNEWIQTIDWDCIVLDEYHYGACHYGIRVLYE